MSQGMDEKVVQWLQQHPEFFAGRDELLKQMYIPHSSGQAISLLARQNELLRRDLAQQRERLQHLTATALDNDHLFLRLRHLILKLLECADWPASLVTLQSEITRRFDVDEVRLINQGETSVLDYPPLARAQSQDDPVVLEKVRMSGKPWCGALSPEDARKLVAETGADGGSVALAPLHFPAGPRGVLVLFARDSDHFYSGMDTVFLSHLADVLARLAYRWQAGQ